MWQFREKTCPKCGTDLTGVKPERVQKSQSNSHCPNCGRIRPVIEVDESGTPIKAPVKKRSTRQRAK